MKKSTGQVAERLRRVALVEVDEGVEGVEAAFSKAHAAFQKAQEARGTEIDRIDTLVKALGSRRKKLEGLK